MEASFNEEPTVDFDVRLASLDLTLFETLGLPGWRDDARSLLALHAATRETAGSFAYLEIGSYLGSSLQTYVRDPHCTTAASIDPRPEIADDDQWGEAWFADNSTQHMLDRLGVVPQADLEKLRTYESDAHDIEVEDLPERPSICFVDGEHTHAAALSDARFCLSAATRPGVIVFHDRAVIPTAIADFLDELDSIGEDYFAYPLPSHLFVVELGPRRLFDSTVLQRAAGRQAMVWRQINRGPTARMVRLFLVGERRMRRLLPRPVKDLVRRAADRDKARRDIRTGPAGELPPR